MRAFRHLAVLVRDNTLTNEELGRLFEAGIGGREDHVRFMQVLSRNQRAVLADDREEILKQAGKTRLVTIRDC